MHAMVKRTAAKGGVNQAISPHWLRHAHGSHAIDRGASLPEVQATLGHSNISTTSGYLHARPDSSSGLVLDSSDPMPGHEKKLARRWTVIHSPAAFNFSAFRLLVAEPQPPKSRARVSCERFARSALCASSATLLRPVLH